ncbi:hypothetical protein AAG570_001193 [Ranatra chinensis]|uniref:Uncharacterized protein n=1 Tax=Ranatra chinensis TaxID=642074 RepID=A0ABD0YBX4_9HEMI
MAPKREQEAADDGNRYSYCWGSGSRGAGRMTMPAPSSQHLAHIFLLAMSAAADTNRVVVNYWVDQEVVAANYYMPRYLELYDFDLGNMTGEGVRLGAFYTLKRAGDCYLYMGEDGKLTREDTLRLENMTLEVEELTAPGVETRDWANFLVEDNLLVIKFGVCMTADCEDDLREFKFTRLDRVMLQAGDPAIDGRSVSSTFAPKFMNYLNKALMDEEGQNLFYRFYRPHVPIDS